MVDGYLNVFSIISKITPHLSPLVYYTKYIYAIETKSESKSWKQKHFFLLFTHNSATPYS